MTETRMVIAVDIRGSEGYQNFMYEIFKVITAQNPQHTFLFIFEKPYDPFLVFSENVIPFVVLKSKTFLLLPARVNFRISSLLKKYKSNVFLTAQTLSRTKVPQCLIASENVSSKSLKKARNIFADSEYSKKEITEKYKIANDKIYVVHKGVNEIFQPILFEKKEIIKEQYANGNEYFLATVTVQSQNNIVNLLKAFSVFKKRQKSNMQLLIHTQTEVAKEISAALRLFKFKSDVKILRNIDNKKLTVIIGSAYAFISPFAKDGYSHVLEAMKCDVPVIASNDGAIPEVASDAALYVNSNDHKDTADKMMLIYKDEKLRQQLIEKGSEQVEKFSWDNVADSFWKCIEKACW